MTDAEGERIADDIRRTLRLLVIATAVLAALLVGLVVWVYFDGRANDRALRRESDRNDRALAAESKRTTASLCAFRADLERRISDGEKFLKTHPEGLPRAEISAAELQRSIDGLKRTVTSLRSLECPPLVPVP